jgi:hypothetical protein
MKNTAALLCVLSLVACSGERKMARQLNREIDNLGEDANTYWYAIRWADYGTAAGYYADQDYRVDWMNRMVTSPDYRYSSASVMRVEVSLEHDPDDLGATREGKVYVQVQGYRMPEQIMEQKMITQQWKLYDAGWFVDIEAEEAASAGR